MCIVLWLEMSSKDYLIILQYLLLTIADRDVYNGFQSQPFTDGINFHVIHDAAEISGIQEDVLQPALDLWKHSVRPRHRTDSNLLIPRVCSDSENYLKEDKRVCLRECNRNVFCGGSMFPQDLLDACFLKVENNVSEQYSRGAGVSEDFVLFVDIEQNCANRHASAEVCSFDQHKFRPIAGKVRLCSSVLRSNRSQREFYRNVVAHEIGHLLGIDENLYGLYRYRNGSYRTAQASGYQHLVKQFPKPSENTIAKRHFSHAIHDNAYTVSINLITLPAVVDVARKYFNCNDLLGVPLENQGLDNKRNRAHFETRILAEELMAAFPRENMRLTNFTLAFLLETGWYDVSHALAQTMTWGRNAGCDFVQKTCYTYMEDKRKAGLPTTPFCDWTNINRPACVPDRSGFGFCELQTFRESLGYLTPLPPNNFGHTFTNAHVGGIRIYEDYCPSISSNPDLRAWNRISQNCKTLEDTIPRDIANPAMESFGTQSICIDHVQHEVWTYNHGVQSTSLRDFGASCHKYRCPIGTGLQILFESTWITCPVSGGTVEVDVHHDEAHLIGRVFCPTCTDVCELPICEKIQNH